jgi:hypothetical protein
MSEMKRKVIRTSMLLLALLAPFLIWRVALRFDVHHQLAKIRAAGLPANLKELDKWYPAVPEEQNAALLVSKAMESYVLTNRAIIVDKFKLPSHGEKLSPTKNEYWREQLRVDSKALAKVDDALRLPYSRYPIDLSMGLATRLPHLAYLKSFGLLYQCQAVLAMEAGNYESASSNIIKILLLAGTLDKEPSLVSQFVRLKLVDFAIEALETRIDTAPMNASETTNLVTAFEHVAGASDQFATALVGERANLAALFFMTDAEAARMLSPPPDEIARRSFPHHRSIPLRIAGFYDLDLGFFLNSMGKGIEAAKQSPPALLRIGGYFSKAAEKARSRYYMASPLLSAYSGAVIRPAEGDAKLQLARAALAVEQFERIRADCRRNSLTFLWIYSVSRWIHLTLNRCDTGNWKPDIFCIALAKIGTITAAKGNRRQSILPMQSLTFLLPCCGDRMPCSRQRRCRRPRRPLPAPYT